MIPMARPRYPDVTVPVMGQPLPRIPVAHLGRKPEPARRLRLLERVRRRLRTRRYSPRTEEAYCDWIRRFILYHERRHPMEMSEAEVSAFLTHLA
ncbi:MAG TPA: site-specific integrase, partial [Gemmatimonadaceae bacterium]